jgi:hypothetical protein
VKAEGKEDMGRRQRNEGENEIKERCNVKYEIIKRAK